MPWQETCVMDERRALVEEWLRDEPPVAELARHYGVSRRVVYKTIERFEAAGWAGLADRSRAPHRHPNGTSDEVIAAVVALRQRRPSWGAKKIRARLMMDEPAVKWPALSTINAILDGHGLVVHRRPRQRAMGSAHLTASSEANRVWGIDFKGWFRTGDGERCDPLSLSDLYSRYVLRLQAVERCDGETVWAILDAAFREYGLPEAMRSDNGPPFAGLGLGGLSHLAVRLIKAGVRPERIAPGKPQQNGRHERLHLTLKQETAMPPAANRRAQQRRFDEFRRVFNDERPHEALGQQVPAGHYAPTVRRYSGRLCSPEYGDDADIRRVRQNGQIKWRGELVFISQALIGEPIALTPADLDGRWVISYGSVALGVIDAAGKLHRLRPQPQPNPRG